MDETNKGPVTGGDWREAVRAMLDRLDAVERFAREAREREEACYSEAKANAVAKERERLRDGFAAAALHGLLASGADNHVEEFAAIAYRYSDAMLDARAK